MIAYLRGTLQNRELSGNPAEKIVVEVAGVGFELIVSRRTALTCGEIGDEITISTSLSIRENDWTIFGFSSRDERDMFTLLQSVSGVGPKLALGLVGALGTQQVADAITSDDQKQLSQAPGVGSKVAQRIILELKPKMDEWHRQRGLTAAAPAVKARHLDEARSILEGLGYTLTEINLAFKQAEEDAVEEDVEILVRHSLKVLGAAGR